MLSVLATDSYVSLLIPKYVHVMYSIKNFTAEEAQKRLKSLHRDSLPGPVDVWIPLLA